MNEVDTQKIEIEAGTPVLVATRDRGVYAGRFVEERENGDVVLSELRMCVYWSVEVRGLVGLAANGPNEKSRITPMAPSGLLKGVVVMARLSDQAWAAWEAEPWG